MELFDKAETSAGRQRHSPRPAVFIHIQKTAGATIVEAARTVHGSSVIAFGDFVALDRASLSSVQFVSGHFGYDYVSDLLQSRYSFTFLRDPVERVLSLYYFCRSQSPGDFPIYQLAHAHELEEFLSLEDPVVRAHVVNHQTWQLASGNPGMSIAELAARQYPFQTDASSLSQAMQHLDALDFVGLQETFQKDAETLYSELGIPLHGEAPVRNQTINRPKKNDLSSTVRRRVEDMTDLDHALYEHALTTRHED